MLLRLFKSNQPIVLILIPVFCLLLWGKSLFNPENIEYISTDFFFMPFYQVIHDVIGTRSVFSKLLAVVLVTVNAFLLVKLNTRYLFIRTRTQLPAIFYVLLTSSYLRIQYLNPLLFSTFFIILAIDKLMSSFKREKLSFKIFDASLLISVSSLFYFNTVFLISFIWIGLIILRPFKWREWVFTLFGLVIPYIFVFSYYFLTDKGIEVSANTLLSFPLTDKSFIYEGILNKLFFFYFILLIIVTSIYMMRVFGTKKVHSRKFFIYFLWLFIITSGLYFFIPSVSIEIVMINALSVCFLFSHFFLNLKSRIVGELLFTILFLFIIVKQYISF